MTTFSAISRGPCKIRDFEIEILVEEGSTRSSQQRGPARSQQREGLIILI
jgi:hypothetical protein